MLKRKNTTIPFYMDPWFWVKLMVFVIFAVFLVWPFSSIITNAFKSGAKRSGMCWRSSR